MGTRVVAGEMYALSWRGVEEAAERGAVVLCRMELEV